MSLTARTLEAAGVPTVVLGSALDIVEHCGVPRFAFTDFPLGNPCGKPGDQDMQLAITRFALSLLDSAVGPNTTMQTPYRWSANEAWRAAYARVDDDNRDQLAAAGAARRAAQAELPKR